MDIEAKGATSNTRYGLAAIEDFIKIADVVPIKNKTLEEMIIVLKQGIYLNGKTEASIFR